MTITNIPFFDTQPIFEIFLILLFLSVKVYVMIILIHFSQYGAELDDLIISFRIMLLITVVKLVLIKPKLQQEIMSVHFELSENQKLKELIKDVILKAAKEQHPETKSQLVMLVHQKTDLSEDVMNLINQLEDEGKIQFSVKREMASVSSESYFFKSESAWYWTILAVAIATAITAFTIPQDLYPLVYLRNILGVIFVLFLPGFAFVKALFPLKVPIETSSESFDTIERVVLSVGMSLALASIIGLILYYSPIGAGAVQYTLSLLIFAIIFATIALIREHQAKSIIISNPS